MEVFTGDKNRSLSVLANREARPLRLFLGWVIFMGAVLIEANSHKGIEMPTGKTREYKMTAKRSATLSKGIGLQLSDIGFRDGIRGHNRRDLSLMGIDFSLPESAWYEYGYSAGSDIRSRCRM
jgi:hypothetical protein